MDTNGHKWTLMDTFGHFWTQVDQVDTSRCKWEKVDRSWHKWTLVDTSVHKWRIVDATWCNLIQFDTIWYNLIQFDTNQLTQICTNFVLVFQTSILATWFSLNIIWTHFKLLKIPNIKILIPNFQEFLGVLHNFF